MSQAVSRTELFARGQHVLVAVSGGADSMALLGAVLASAEGLAVSVSVAHFDHRLRADSSTDGDTVEAFCEARGVACIRGKGDVAARAQQEGETTEQAARHLRYAFLEQTADRIGADRIATGHTQDDQVETVLMRVMRGAGIRGLSGIPEMRGRVVRPILSVTREDTESFCNKHHIPFVEDPSNQDTRFARNWIRHRVLPALRAADGGVEGGLLRVARTSLDAVTDIRRVTDPILDSAVTREGDAWALNTDALADLDDTARFVLLADLIAHHLPVESDAGREHFRWLIALSKGDAHSGRMASLPGLSARREHASLVFYPGRRHPGEPAAETAPAEVPLPGQAQWRNFLIHTEILDRNAVSDSALKRAGQSHGAIGAHVAYFAGDAIAPPIVARAPRPGDRIRPFGMNGRRKLSDLFIDRRIEARHRPGALVISDGHEIIWLVGVATCESARITPDTPNVVRITVTRE